VIQQDLPVSENLAILPEVNIFPNPVEDGRVHLSFGQLLDPGYTTFDIYDSRGALLLSEGSTLDQGQVTHTLAVSSLRVGLYHVLVSQDRVYHAFGKFIISQ